MQYYTPEQANALARPVNQPLLQRSEADMARALRALMCRPVSK